MIYNTSVIPFINKDNKPINEDAFPITLEMLRNQAPDFKPAVVIPEVIANWLAKKRTSGSISGTLRFSQVTTEHEWEKVKALRLRVYSEKSLYMLDHLNPDGSDSCDSHSVVFAAWWHGMAVATVRFTSFPFESSSYIDLSDMDSFLGDGWQSSYIEWGRLLVDKNCGINGLSNALITYAGFKAISKTGFRKYFGYSKPVVRKTFSHFNLDKNKRMLKIPSRGDHDYLMLKGDFINEFKCYIKNLVM